MAVAAGPHVFRNPVLTVEATSYTNNVSKARLVPETPEQRYDTLDPTGQIVDYGNTSWTLELAGIQGALAEALWTATPGDELEVVLQTKPGTGQRKATFTIIAKPVPFGGEVNTMLTFDETFAVQGAPVWSVSS